MPNPFLDYLADRQSLHNRAPDPQLKELWNRYVADKLTQYGEAHGARSLANEGNGSVIGGLAGDLGHALHVDDYRPSPEAEALYANPVPGEVQLHPLVQGARTAVDVTKGLGKSLANTIAKGYGAAVGSDYRPFPKPFEGADPQSIRFLSHASDAAQDLAGTPAFKLPAMAYDYLREGAAGGARALGGPEVGGVTYGLMSAVPDAFLAEGGSVGEAAAGVGDAITGAVKDAAGSQRNAAFAALADAQRGAPEEAMRAAQRVLMASPAPSAATYSHLLEHVGDLTHRMSEWPEHQPGLGLEAVPSKVRTGLNGLSYPYDLQNMQALRGTPELEAYAKAHAALPVYNQPQLHAREAAVALGGGDFDAARHHLASLQSMIDGGSYNLWAGSHDPHFPDPRRQRFADGGSVGETAIGVGDAIAGAVKDAALPLIQLHPSQASTFSEAMSAAKAAHPWGDQVYQYSPEEYANMQMFMTPDQKAGYAIKPDGDIVSVFKHPDSPEKGFGPRALNHAVQNGGTKLDAFDTELPKMYEKAGFKEYARQPWDDAFAPPNWDYQKFAQYNGGKPDVVYMVHPQAGLARYKAETDPGVVNNLHANGELPKVYHGTTSPEDFKGFDIRDNAYYDPHPSGYNGFVAEDRSFASDYANNGVGGGKPNLEALAKAGHTGDPAGARVVPMHFGPRKLYDPRTTEGQRIAMDWFSSPAGQETYNSSPRLVERLLSDYYKTRGSAITPELRQQYAQSNLFGHHVANPHSNWVPMEVPEWVDHLRSLGYDAAAIREAGFRNYGLLDPGAVKSSVGNVGTYDRSNPDLLKADGGKVDPFRLAYPGANPAYGTKPMVINGQRMTVNADPEVIARARAALQRMQDQYMADSARRAVGQATPAAQYGQKPPQFAKGGEAGEVLGGLGESVEQAVVDALRAGRPAPQLAERYPARLPGQMMADPKTGKEFMGKVLSPEAEALGAYRKKIQKDIDAGNYDPYFPPAQRANVDPSLYPATFDSLGITPAKPATIAKYEAHAAGPEATRLLSAAYERQMPNSENWYYMKQLADEYVKHLGPERGQAAFKQNFADAMAATTGGADPTANFLMAHYGNYLRNKGLSAPEEAYNMSYPIGGRYASGNMGMYNKYITAGQPLTADTPKRANFAYNFLGHGDRATIDEQMMGGMGPTPWNGKVLAAPPDGTYGVYEGAVHALADKYGVDPRGFQDVAWAGLKGTHGMPMIDHVNQSIERTSRVTGLPQDEVAKGLVNGSLPMYARGGSAS